MLLPTNTAHQTNLFGTDLLQQLDSLDPLLQLAAVIPWSEFEREFAQYYTPGVGRPAKPIRLMVGLQLLKYIENLSDEKVVVQFKRNRITRHSVDKQNLVLIYLAIVQNWYISENELARKASRKYFRSVWACMAKSP